MMPDPRKLIAFLDRAAKATYAGGGKYEQHPQRPGFSELVYKDPPFVYRDSYIGFTRSGGQEIVYYDDKPVWWSGYGGGMTAGSEDMASQTFAFLKTCLSQDEPGFASLRGPHQFAQGDWKYTYTQEGDVTDFTGLEHIYYQDKLVFFHHAVGGILILR